MVKVWGLLFLGLLPFIGHSQTNAIKPYAPELFPAAISGGVCGFSVDGKIIYFVREDTFQKKIFLYQAKKNGNKWVDAQTLSFSGVYSDMGGRLTPDGKTFYFTSDRPGGSTNEKDIWNIWVTRLTNNTWSPPEALSALNNKGMECCPLPLKDGSIMFSADRGKPNDWWISVWDPINKTELMEDSLNQTNAWQWPSSLGKNNKVLFLNSMRRKDSRGMDDIYVSFYKNNKWSTPINAGEPINTKVYEDGAILSPGGKQLIFNRHETAVTPSLVMSIAWPPLYKKLKKQFTTNKQKT